MNIRWTTKSRALSLFDFLGRDALYFCQKYISKRSVFELPAIPRPWSFHKDNIAEFAPKSLIEFGAGKDLGQNLYVSQPGLKQSLVDLNPMLDLSLVNRVIVLLRDGHDMPGLRDVHSLEDLGTLYGITYEAPVDMAATDFPDGVFNFCILTNMLEHIPAESLEHIMNELRRVLKPGGVISA